ncbi:cobalamin-dependent protein, partial [Ruminococcaceae bacterium OttesenSCG-928-A11]|nr:cobalamin-dependent protein [Ruminococcaceae bacterium OttesenSCG-928-A11]
MRVESPGEEVPKVREDEIRQQAKAAVIEADEAGAMKLIDEAAASDAGLLAALNEGFNQGINTVNDEFEKGKISLPELIYSSEVMKNVLARIMQKTGQIETGSTGTIVIATVEGDLHDIGKGIVATTLQMAGFKVVDLGREVPVEMIVEAAEENNADIIGTSALLTSTLAEQKKLELELRKKGLRGKYKTMVGGATCTTRWAKRIGADA